MRPNLPGTGGRLAGWLLVSAGAFTVVNNYLPGSELLDVRVLNTTGLLAIVAGLVAIRLPWPRWHPRASLVLALFAFALIAVSDRYGGVSAYSYAVYFVVIFVWVGVAHPPRTSYALAPVAAVAYVLPLALAPGSPPRNAISSVTVAIPVCVLVAEMLARTVRRQAVAQAETAARAARVERLAGLVGELNADLDADAILLRVCRGARELVGAGAAAFVGAGEALLAADGDVAGLHPALVVPSVGRGAVRGELRLLFADPRHTVSADQEHLVRLLAGHAGAALANAATYAEVVAARDHEQAVVDGMADGMAVVANDGRVVGWNAAAERLTGLPASEVIGGTLPFPVGPAGVPVDHHLPDGRWLELVASPIAGETVVGFRDITKAKSLDEAKDLFLATTSHELRTPITVVKGYVAILRRSWQRLTPAERDDALAAVEDRTDSLVALVDHLLLGSRAGAARYSLEPEPFDLVAAVRAATAGFATVSDRHDVRVDADDVPRVLGDPAAVAPVVGQLVENAIKYSPAGGDVVVTVRRGEGFAAVDVLDRGVGIPEGAEQEVFTRFWQAGKGDRREYAGLGLGLHIVRQLVEAQGGSVHAANREGGGARIGFTLPYAPAVPETRRATDFEKRPADL